MPMFSMTVIPTEKAGYKPDKKACGMLKPSKKRGATDQNQAQPYKKILVQGF